jgi:IS605 OrfB family transposase
MRSTERRPVRQAFRFELDPNQAQRVQLAKSVGVSQYVYNWGLAESQRAYEATGKRPRLGELQSRLVQLKKGDCPWPYEVSAHIGQQALVAAAVVHDGHAMRVLAPQQPLRRNLARLRRLDRQLARKQRGSQNREKAKLRRARLHYKISCQRQDFLHHLSSDLARAKPVIVLEDVYVKGLHQNRNLSLSISDAGLGELRRQLAYKCDWYGSTLVVVDRFFPSTQLCSGCGVLNSKLKG